MINRKSPGMYYKITQLSMNSPVTMEVEAVPKPRVSDYSSAIIRKLSNDLAHLTKGIRSDDVDMGLLESHKSLVQPLKKRHLYLALNQTT
ncbi:MAG: hypothetical protein LM517_08935 [Nitrosomonas sp.]|nr:hypothetical protein [Nitrosomonas sp.]